MGRAGTLPRSSDPQLSAGVGLLEAVMESMFGGLEATSAVLAVLLAGQGCSVKHPPDAALGLDGGGVQGRVAFDILPDPNSRRPELSPEQHFTGPMVLERKTARS